MNSLSRKILKTSVVTVGLLLFACVSQAQVATHSCAGYLSPGTNTIVSQFVYPETSLLGALAWFPVMPDGWLIGTASGDGGPLVSPDKKSILFTAFFLPTPLNFTYTIVIPSGFTTTVLFRAQAEYYLDFQPLASYVWATPDPLVMDNLEKTLEVISACGVATPAVGIHSNRVNTLVHASVPVSAYLGPTQYVCTGWSMVGHEPSSGTANSFSMTVTNHAVLTWNWSIANISPTVEGGIRMTGYRTRANVMSEASLLAHVSDPDGDAVTLVSVDTSSACGGTVSRANGHLTYTPPKSTASVQDSFTFTVQDGKGGSMQGVVSVKVLYGGSAIRVF